MCATSPSQTEAGAKVSIVEQLGNSHDGQQGGGMALKYCYVRLYLSPVMPGREGPRQQGKGT